MTAILATIFAHFYNVGINNKPCCSQHNMSISNALNLVLFSTGMVFESENTMIIFLIIIMVAILVAIFFRCYELGVIIENQTLNYNVYNKNGLSSTIHCFMQRLNAVLLRSIALSLIVAAILSTILPHNYNMEVKT